MGERRVLVAAAAAAEARLSAVEAVARLGDAREVCLP
jgi:hypothetical protein